MTTIKLKGILGITFKNNKLVVTITNEYIEQIDPRLIPLAGNEVVIDIDDSQTVIEDVNK